MVGVGIGTILFVSDFSAVNEFAAIDIPFPTLAKWGQTYVFTILVSVFLTKSD